MKLFLKKANKKLWLVGIKTFLSHINIKKLCQAKAKLFEEDLTEKGLFDSLKIM